MKKETALVVLSGGQDSTTALFWAKLQFDRVLAITFDYGQRHVREIEAARKVAEMAGLSPEDHEVVVIPNILKGTSPLVSAQPLEMYPDFKTMDAIIGDRVETTFVPMRNPFFLTVAANRAMVAGADHLVTGVCQMDNANYPDCREGFILSMERMVRQAMGAEDFFIHAPLMFRSKAETIALAKDLQTAHKLPAWDALAYTHTCYSGTYPPCGTCHACVLRAEGFDLASEADPLILRAVSEGLMEMPTTGEYLNKGKP